MGGRIHGFLGGVLLTSALTYYTAEYIQKNREVVSAHLRASSNIIDNRIISNNDLSNQVVPINKHINTETRVSFTETCKDIWNDEIIKMVNWVYSINWYQWGITADKKMLELTDKVVNSITERK